jgi:hypothetical protein
MRAFATAEQALWSSHHFAVYVRCYIRDSGGTWRDMSSLLGDDWLEGVRLSAGIDDPVASADLSLSRAHNYISLAPLRTLSLANLVTGAYSPLLCPGRFVRIDAGYGMPGGGAPVQWRTLFVGIIDSVDWGSDPITIACRDLAARLQDSYLEEETVCAQAYYQCFRIWRPGMQVRSSYYPFCLPSIVNGFYYYTMNTSLGTTGATEPTWPLTPGQTVNDGSVTWRCEGSTSANGQTAETLISGIVNQTLIYLGAGISFTDNLYSVWNPFSLLWTTSSNWTIKPYRQDRTALFEAVRNLAAMIGWDLRMGWDNTFSDRPRLVFGNPARSKTTPDFTFTAADYFGVSALKLGLEGIRNVVQVVYSDASTLAANGIDKLRRTIQVSDASSIAKYGRRFCEIAEASTSQIDSSTEATTLANGVLSDLAEPTAEQEIEMQFFYPAELGDLYSFAPNSVHYDTTQSLAVVALEHNLSKGAGRTTLTCRGKPSGAFLDWHRRIAYPGVAPAFRSSAPMAATDIQTENWPGKTVITFTPPDRWSDAELYISPTSNFTPSAATLYARGRTTEFTAHLIGGPFYYAQIIMRDEYGWQSAPSVEFILAPTT